MFCSFGLTLGICMSKDPAQAKRGPKLVLLFSDRFGLHCFESGFGGSGFDSLLAANRGS